MVIHPLTTHLQVLNKLGKHAEAIALARKEIVGAERTATERVAAARTLVPTLYSNGAAEEEWAAILDSSLQAGFAQLRSGTIEPAEAQKLLDEICMLFKDMFEAASAALSESFGTRCRIYAVAFVCQRY